MEDCHLRLTTPCWPPQPTARPTDRYPKDRKNEDWSPWENAYLKLQLKILNCLSSVLALFAISGHSASIEIFNSSTGLFTGPLQIVGIGDCIVIILRLFSLHVSLAFSCSIVLSSEAPECFPLAHLID